MKPWRLKRTRQCEKCPWREDVDIHDVPGYGVEQHENVMNAIAQDVESSMILSSAMSCHDHETSDEVMCIGWLVNQVGVGNNIGLRIEMTSCTNRDKIEPVGKQRLEFPIPNSQSDRPNTINQTN